MSKKMLLVIQNVIMPIDRAHRVVLGTGLEHLEHLHKRIWEGFNRISIGKKQYLGIYSLMV
jgi:hypothetical protein